MHRENTQPERGRALKRARKRVEAGLQGWWRSSDACRCATGSLASCSPGSAMTSVSTGDIIANAWDNRGDATSKIQIPIRSSEGDRMSYSSSPAWFHGKTHVTTGHRIAPA
eukprot:2336886-Rhodomonas_salina.2